MGFTAPTPIQLRAIPLIMAGKDAIGRAQTGTGKTAAFALPILSLLGDHEQRTRCLVLEPTRELAAQVETAVHDFARFTKIRTAVLYGGVGYGKQLDALRDGADVIIATPGRLLDHLERGACRLDGVKFLVLDEADRMLDMGFLPDVKRIVQKVPRERHTFLFSATIPPEIATLVQWAMKNPETVEIGARRTHCRHRRTRHLSRRRDSKTSPSPATPRTCQIPVRHRFCRTKHRADSIANLLKKNNHAVAVLHSNRTQREREDALRGFRQGHYEALVATDIASRGLDIADVSHVVNYDVPQHPEDYIHRIGPHRPRGKFRRRLHPDGRGRRPARLCHRALHRQKSPPRQTRKPQITNTPRSSRRKRLVRKGSFPGKVPQPHPRRRTSSALPADGEGT